MAAGKIIGIVTGIGLGLVAVLGFSAYNTANRQEEAVIATYENNQNILGQYSNAIQEAAQIPAMQRDDLQAVIIAALEGRYGENGSQATFQAIQEQNPQIDSAVYTKLQQIIQSGRKDFELGQTKLLDQKRVYRTSLGSFPQGAMMGMLGFPRIDLDEYGIVTNARTDAAFETKREEPIQLR